MEMTTCKLWVIGISLTLLLACPPASFAGSILGWGDNTYTQATPQAGTDFTDIAAGIDFSLALRKDGSVVAWGTNLDSQCNVPATPDFKAIAAGEYHSILLKKDGSLAAVGASRVANDFGQTVCPAGNDFVAIAAGGWHSVALRANGTLAAWGYPTSGVSTPPSGSNYTAIDAGHTHSIALKADGSVVVWGNNSAYKLITTAPTAADFKAVAAGGYHCVVLKKDGSLQAWGNNTSLQCTVPAGNDFVAVAAKGNYSLARKADGTVVAWGDNTSSTFIRKVAAGYRHALAIEEMGTIILNAPNGGQVWATGSVQTITWTADAAIVTVAIDYSIDNGASWIPVSPPNVGNTGTYNWFVPIANSQQCLVRASSSPVAYATDAGDAPFTIYQCTLQSDANGDCVVNIADFAIMAEEWLTSGFIFDPEFDPVSLDGDGDVDVDDFVLFSKAWLSEPGDPNWNPKCDLSFPPDNFIDQADFAVFSAHWK
jgi:alpha-tubulin suppressor-like RCC1 family protein